MAENNTNPESVIEPVVAPEVQAESSVIRTLRQQIKDKDSKIQELSKTNEEVVHKVNTMPDEISKRMEKLEFDQFINTKPNLADKKDDIWNVKTANPNLTMEDATALVLGKSILSATPSPSVPPVYGSSVNITPNISDLASKTDEELANQARQELSDMLG